MMMLVQLCIVFRMCVVGDFFIPRVIGTWVAGAFCWLF